MGLRHRTIFITGGNSGIGKAAALMYGNEPDVRIALSYYSGKEAAEEVVMKLQEKGCRAMAVYMDLADEAGIERATEEVTTHLGGTDILINNAVYWGSPGERGKAFEDISIEEWRKMLNINLLGTVKVTKSIVPHMRRNGFGRIVNISSDLAVDSMPGSGPYGTMKAALTGFTSNLVTELSKYNILSNVICPSLTFTEKALNRFPKRFREAAKTAFPTGRVTTPEDVASLILYLGSEANRHINGETIRAGGKGSQPMLNVIFENSGKDQSLEK